MWVQKTLLARRMRVDNFSLNIYTGNKDKKKAKKRVVPFSASTGDCPRCPYFARFSCNPTEEPEAGLRIPRKGKIQFVVANPNATPIFWFVVAYDLSKVHKRSKVYVRQTVQFVRNDERCGDVVIRRTIGSAFFEMSLARPVTTRFFMLDIVKLSFPCTHPLIDATEVVPYTRKVLTQTSPSFKLTRAEQKLFKQRFDKEKKRRRSQSAVMLSSDTFFNRKDDRHSFRGGSPTSVVDILEATEGDSATGKMLPLDLGKRAIGFV